jgi:Ca-activated chloride channel family protein
LTVLGFGMGNTNDAMMEQISNRGNGVYGFIDSRREAYRQMVQQLTGNLMTVAKDVKIQVEFNPHRVSSYRLIGYENRLLAAEDFNNDQKDAGEVGAGHRVTALYEIVPIGSEASQSTPGVDELRYQQRVATPPAAVEPADEVAQELLAVKLRYKQPEGDTSRLLTFPLRDEADDIRLEDSDFQWAACVAQFGMLLRHSPHLGSSNWSQLLEQATQAAGMTPDAPRQECLEMMRRAAQLSSGRTGSVKR